MLLTGATPDQNLCLCREMMKPKTALDLQGRDLELVFVFSWEASVEPGNCAWSARASLWQDRMQDF